MNRPSPAFVLSLLALIVALSGTAYAASKIDGRTIQSQSIPGNRLKPGSITGAQLSPGVLPAPQAPASAPTHVARADTAGSAQTAAHAASADTASHAETAASVSGLHVGCPSDRAPFAGACWDAWAHIPATAADAAVDCAARGGVLPSALELAAFAQSGAAMAVPREWAADPVVSAEGVYTVAIVAPDGTIGSAAGGVNLPYHCVLPVVR